MKQFNGHLLMVLARSLEKCSLLADQPIEAYRDAVAMSLGMLDILLKGTANLKLNESITAARRLESILQLIFADGDLKITEIVNGQRRLMETNVDNLRELIRDFDTVIAGELTQAPIFVVVPTGLYNIRRMVMNEAAAGIYEGYIDRIPVDAIADTNTGGRCLAFALATAAGFHIARATEAVMKKQMDVFGCAPPKDSQRNWGHHIKRLRGAGAHPKVTHHLEQIKDLHRNPLLHAEVTLTMPEAISLWSVCTSVIQAMVADMERKNTSPVAEIMAMLPVEEPGDEGQAAGSSS